VADSPCPACGSNALEEFHQQAAVPANSCLLLASQDEAIQFPTGAIELAYCAVCGFITNTRFDAALAEYSDRYEETQAFSPRFVSFARSLAQQWVERHDLAGKTVLEIGCGKGEFLALMAEAGIGHGIGIDPGVHPERIESPHSDRLEWITDFYSEQYAHIQADAIVCRHTLEHIAPVSDFLRMIRRAIGDRLDTRVLFELPDAQRVLDEVAFWDIYYEHCSYFSAGSLARLFEREGFELTDLSLAYDDQYLILDARPIAPGTSPDPWQADDMASLRAGVEHYAVAYRDTIHRWETRLADLAAKGRTAVIWGAGSKGVSFLSVVGDNVAAAVDINPHKHGMFMAGTGHAIVAPSDLPGLEPHLVIAMNPIYVTEIRRDLDELGVGADLEAL
jgi:SAM-dependent methyltransferase